MIKEHWESWVLGELNIISINWLRFSQSSGQLTAQFAWMWRFHRIFSQNKNQLRRLKVPRLVPFFRTTGISCWKRVNGISNEKNVFLAWLIVHKIGRIPGSTSFNIQLEPQVLAVNRKDEKRASFKVLKQLLLCQMQLSEFNSFLTTF